MNKPKKRLIALISLIMGVVILLSAVLFISGTAGNKDTSSSDISDASEESVNTAKKEGTPVEALSGYKAKDIEKKAIKSGFIPVLKDDKITLYYKAKTAEVAVYSAENNQMIYSNPQNIPETVKGIPLHKVMSQLYITYYQENNQIKFYSSSFDALGRDQVTAQIIDGNTLSVNYVFGKKKITKEMLPIAIPKAKFEEKVLPKLSEDDAFEIKRQYKLISSKDTLTDANREKYEKTYKNFGSTDLYILNTYIASFDIEPIYDILYSTDYTQADFKEDNKEAGNTEEIVDKNVVFDLTLDYKLSDGVLNVDLDCSKLRQLDNANIYSVDILQFFGCASTKEKGYFLVPDGSGGLISFNSTKSGAAAYSGYVYGADQTIRVNNLNNNDVQIGLPVLGISNDTNKNGMFITAEKSAEYCKINADIAEETVPYNMAYFSAIVFPYDEMTVNNPISGGGTTQIYTHQQKPFRGNISLSYNFLAKNKNGYSDMANLYREKLIEDGILTEKVKGDLPAVYSLLGGIDVQKHFLGIPYTGMQSLTTFKDAEKIIDALKKEGIDNQNVKYLDWFNGGAKQTVADTVNVLGCLGGKKGLDKLIKTDKASIYPDVSFTSVHNSLFDGFSTRKDAARLTYNETALLYPINIPKNYFDYNSDYSYIVSPNSYNKIIDKFLKNYKYENLSVSDLAALINSDFDDDKYAERTASLKLTLDAVKKLSGEKNIMASKPNLYAVPYVDIMTDMPITTSGANIIDTEIPFLQMVYSGYKDMTSNAINLSYGDYSLTKLLSFATAPNFTFGYENSSVIMGTNYTEYYSFCFDDWKQDAVELYKAYAQAAEKVRGESIVGHKILDNGLCVLTYENGGRFYINDTNSKIDFNGQKIEAKSYIYKEGN